MPEKHYLLGRRESLHSHSICAGVHHRYNVRVHCTMVRASKRMRNKWKNAMIFNHLSYCYCTIHIESIEPKTFNSNKKVLIHGTSCEINQYSWSCRIKLIFIQVLCKAMCIDHRMLTWVGEPAVV